MKIEEAILYVLAGRNAGMRGESLAGVSVSRQFYFSFFPTEKAAPTLSPSWM